LSNYRLNKRYYKIASLVYLAVLLFISPGCGSKEVTKQLSAEERFALGMKEFNNENYLEAIEEFKVVSLQYQGSKVADSAQFYLAECRYLREEYILAAFEYDLLLSTMPSSNLASRARFRRATCYYDLSPKSTLDQNFTKKAIDDYQEFLEYHSADTLASLASQRISELNTKLAKKDYENGITYMHMEYYKAATYYFDQVLEKFHDTQYAEPSLLKKAEALTYRKKFADAKEAIDRFFEKFPESTLKSDAVQLQNEIETKLSEDNAEKQKKEIVRSTDGQVPQPGS
jgi:outer membrane protein assembly factor BamD